MTVAPHTCTRSAGRTGAAGSRSAEPGPADPRPAGLSRRCALLGLGGAGAAALLAACSGGSTTATGTSGAASAASSPSDGLTSGGATSGGAASGGATSGGSAGGGAIAALSDVPVGGAVKVEVDGQGVLLSQPSAGTVEAFSDVCPHQGGVVSPKGSGGTTFECALHHSQFDADGHVTRGPARRDLTAIAVTVSGTSIVKA